MATTILGRIGLDNALGNESTIIITGRILHRPKKRLLNARILGDTLGIVYCGPQRFGCFLNVAIPMLH